MSQPCKEVAPAYSLESSACLESTEKHARPRRHTHSGVLGNPCASERTGLAWTRAEGPSPPPNTGAAYRAPHSATTGKARCGGCLRKRRRGSSEASPPTARGRGRALRTGACRGILGLATHSSSLLVLQTVFSWQALPVSLWAALGRAATTSGTMCC